jgi:hypothetical protein
MYYGARTTLFFQQPPITPQRGDVIHSKPLFREKTTCIYAAWRAAG